MGRWVALFCGVGAAAMLLAACDRTDTVQRGYRGLAMTQLSSPSSLEAPGDVHTVPEPEPTDPPDPEAPAIEEVYQNVTVLNDLTVLEFSRLMQALSTWVAPEEGCEFCHNPDKLESDEKYTKVVARRMLEMTRRINTEWKQHVGETGVTCWTCHRGQAVPTGDWFSSPVADPSAALIGFRAGQNTAGMRTVGNAALPYDPLSTYLISDHPIRLQGTQALAGANPQPIKKAETTYALMIYMSQSLGVNCTYCHNTRALARWDESTPQRATAWHGIRLVRGLNTDYLIPLQPEFPPHRLSPEGDGPKVGCATCHKGAYKPMYGASMLADYPELAGVMANRPAPPAPPAPVAAVTSR